MGAIPYDEAIKVITSILNPHCSFAFLLGSFGTERFQTESDIDIAAYFKGEYTWETKMTLTENLAQKLDREIDLVNLKGVDLIFARQVVETGRLVFCLNAGELLQWKAIVLSQYPDFKKSREIIEKNLLRRKSNV